MLVIASVKSGEIEMRIRVFLVFLVLLVFAIGKSTWENEI